MQQWRIQPEEGFKLLGGSGRSEAATMVLAPGESTGGPDNVHLGDQWSYVLNGRGRALVSGQASVIEAGSLVLIEAGEPHQIDNTGERPLATLNFYAPPEY